MDSSKHNRPIGGCNSSTSAIVILLMDAPLPVLHRGVVPADLGLGIVDPAEGEIPQTLDEGATTQQRPGLGIAPDPPQMIDHGKEVFPPLSAPSLDVGFIGVEMTSEDLAATSAHPAVMLIVPQKFQQVLETIGKTLVHTTPPVERSWTDDGDCFVGLDADGSGGGRPFAESGEEWEGGRDG